MQASRHAAVILSAAVAALHQCTIVARFAVICLTQSYTIVFTIIAHRRHYYSRIHNAAKSIHMSAADSGGKLLGNDDAVPRTKAIGGAYVYCADMQCVVVESKTCS